MEEQTPYQVGQPLNLSERLQHHVYGRLATAEQLYAEGLHDQAFHLLLGATQALTGELERCLVLLKRMPPAADGAHLQVTGEPLYVTEPIAPPSKIRPPLLKQRGERPVGEG